MQDFCDKVSREDFETFIRTTEAPESLLEHIESCSKCAEEAKRRFDRTAKVLDGLAEILEENVGEDRIRDLCDEVFKEDFETFIETGEASEDLLDHIDSCEKCVAETKRCFDELAKKFDKLREILKTKHPA